MQKVGENNYSNTLPGDGGKNAPHVIKEKVIVLENPATII
jgi:hypothetical protein